MMLDKKRIMAEIAVTTPTGGTTHQENEFSKLLEPKFRQVFYNTYDEVPEQFSKLFHVETSKKAQEFDYGLGAFKPWKQFGKSMTTVDTGTPMPSVDYQKIEPGLERVYTHEEFTSGFMVERKFIDDEQYRIITKLPADLARAGRYKVETDAHTVFNKAFDTHTKGYDGKPLICADHPTLAKGTCSNLVDADFSDTSLKAATTLFRKQVDEAGKIIQMKPDTLVVPPEQEWLAYELIKSAQKPGGNLNDINAIKGRFKIIVDDFLTDKDAVFLMDSRRHKLNFFWRVKPEFKRAEDYDSLVAKYRGYMRYSYGYSDFRGIVGIKKISG